MTKRERSLALGLLTAAVLGGGIFLFYNAFWVPLQELDATILSLKQEVEQKEDRVHKIEAAKARLEPLKQLSLPSQVEFSRREYEIYLSDLLRKSGFMPGFSIQPKPPEKSNPVGTYTRLPYTVVARANLANLVEMLEHFYRTSLLHQVRHLSITRPSTLGAQLQQAELDIRMTVEALIVAGAENRPDLLPGLNRRLGALDVIAALRQAPTGLGLALWAAGPAGPLGPGVLAQPPRRYAAIAKKNIFFGSTGAERLELAEVARFVHLTDITHNTERPSEAFFYDRYNGRMTRLRAETGFDTFQILDNDGEPLVRGKVIRLDDREMVFQVDEDYFFMHVGENLEQALKHRLTGEQLKTLGLGVRAEKVSSGNVSGDN